MRHSTALQTTKALLPCKAEHAVGATPCMQTAASCKACHTGWKLCRLLPDSKLEVLNVGDCSLRIVRNGAVVHEVATLSHEFNMPYQLGNKTYVPDTDVPRSGLVELPEVFAGDLVVMASDGFFDNVWDDDMLDVLAEHAPPGAELSKEETEAVAAELAAFAQVNSLDPRYKSPWAIECAKQPSTGLLRRLFPSGGKKDDITVVVAQLQG